MYFGNHLHGNIKENYYKEIRACIVYEPDNCDEEETRKQTKWSLLADIVVEV